MNLSAHGAKENDLPEWAADACAIKRLLDNSPRPYGLAEIETIYREAF